MATRILHLITAFDPALHGPDAAPSRWRGVEHAPDDCSAVAASIAISLTPQIKHEVLIIGGSRIRDRLARLGISSPNRICPLWGLPAAGARALRRFLHARTAYDAIQPWDDRLARMIPPTARAWAVPSIEELTRLLAMSSRTLAPFPAPSDDPLLLQETAAHAGRLPVVLFGADPPCAGDAASLFRVIGLADKSGERFALVLPRGVRGARRATRLHRDAQIKGPLILTDRSPVEWLSTADVVLTVAVRGGREGLLRALAQARGVPVVTAPDGAETMREFFAPAATQLRHRLRGEPDAPSHSAETAAAPASRGGHGTERGNLPEAWGQVLYGVTSSA